MTNDINPSHRTADNHVNTEGSAKPLESSSNNPTTVAQFDNANTHQTNSAPIKEQEPTVQKPSTRTLADTILLLQANTVDDLEHVRIATHNRIRSIKLKGLDEDFPELQHLNTLAEQLEKLEAAAIKDLERAMKAHYLGPWVMSKKGVGLKQAARLLAAIGDPLYYTKITTITKPIFDYEGNEGTETVEERIEVVERTVSKLWAYCGYHVVDGHAPKHTRGVRSNWSNEGRMRARLIAESCIKQMDSPYRKVYDEARLKYKEVEISDLQKHNRALRKVAKEILKDIYNAAKTLKDQGK